MNITKECVECIVGQIKKATLLLDCEDSLAKSINDEVLKRSKSFDFSKTPPFVAKDVYEYLAKSIDKDDPLFELKEESIKKAKSFLPHLYKKLEESEDRLFTAIKIAVAGNVIDFATTKQFCLDEEIDNIFHMDFAINDYEQFKKSLESSDSFIVLADNAGENVFDKVLIEQIAKLYPNKKLYYATRGKPIINDITTKEAFEVGIDEFCEVISSGVDTPGLDKTRASKEFMEIYEKTPLVLSKGMGNFECLESYNDEKIFFLFKVKCDVVARKIQREVGEIVLKKATI